MISIICPYCNTPKCILFEPCMHDLITKGEGECTCDACNKTFIVYNGKEKLEVKEK